MKKSFISFLISVIVFANTFYISAFAGATPSISVGSVTGTTGATVEVPVILSGNKGFSNLAIEIGYDETALKLTKAVASSNTEATFTRAQSYTANPYNMSWDNAINTAFNGTIVTLTFEIITDTSGEYPITVDYYKGREGNYVDGNNVNYDENFDPLGLSYVDGKITVANGAENSIAVNSNLKVSLTGEIGIGKVYAAIYKNNCMKQLKVYSSSEAFDVTFDSPESGDVVKVMWMKDFLYPMCEADSIILP